MWSFPFFPTFSLPALSDMLREALGPCVPSWAPIYAVGSVFVSKLFMAIMIFMTLLEVVNVLAIGVYYKKHRVGVCTDFRKDIVDLSNERWVVAYARGFPKFFVFYNERTLASLFSAYALLFLSHAGLSTATTAENVFQVYQPVPTGGDGTVGCTNSVLLMEHVFSNSYGKPFIGSYVPPSCDFDTVRLNITVDSKGRQFDRLGHMYLGDVEVFRTSTAEPTENGIVWTYIKDMSPYNALWKQPQKLLFDLGNTITNKYSGSFHVMLTAVFSHEGQVRTADMVLPISAQKSRSNLPSAFTIPADNATVHYQLPFSVSRAVVSISACGQSAEEFWWSNVFSQDTDAFNGTNQLYGYSPFREVQLLIDGVLAGIVWPFPIIFTGGVAPGLWRPIVGIDAFDLRQPEIDITPFLPLITNKQKHSFEIRVIGLQLLEDGTVIPSKSVGAHWVVTGSIFLYLRDCDSTLPSSPIRGFKMPQVVAPPPTIAVTRTLLKTPTGRNDSLSYSVLVERTITINSFQVSWSQELSYSQFGLLSKQGRDQTIHQNTSGTNTVTENGRSDKVTYRYPLFLNAVYSAPNDPAYAVDTQMRRTLAIEATGVTGISTYTLHSGRSWMRSEQQGKAYYKADSRETGKRNSFGETMAMFDANDSYRRIVRAVNESIVYDTETKSGISSPCASHGIFG